MSKNPLYRNNDATPRLLLTKRQAADALGVSPRVLEALEKRGEIQSVQIAPCFPKTNPNAKTRRGPQPMKRYPVDALQEYVANLRRTPNVSPTDDEQY